MERPSWISSVASAKFFGRATIVGVGEIWLCRSVLAGVAMLAATLLLSPRAAALAVIGGVTATGWAFALQRDARLVAAGWYGTNGALVGLWSSWLVTDPRGATLATVVGALGVAWLLDAIVFPLGDAPLALPPLTVPFVIVAFVGTLALPLARDAVERLGSPPVSAPIPGESVWHAAPISPVVAGDVTAAWSAWRHGDYARAHTQFVALAVRAPDVAEVHNGLGWSAFKLDRYDEAERAFRRALALDPRAPAPLDGLGWIAFRRGRYADARRLFETASSVTPWWADPHDGLGWTAYMRGRYREARAHFERAIVLDAGHASALSGLGWTAFVQGDVDEARRRFEAATAEDPGLFVAQGGLGWTLARSGRAREAEGTFAAAIARFPRESGALFGLADARRRLLLTGARPTIDVRTEWSAVRAAFPAPVVVAVLLVAAAVMIAAPWAGTLSILCAGAGATLSVLLAGPIALAWLDLHVQTLVPLGLLVGRVVIPSARHLLTAVLVAALGVAAWAVLHVVNVNVPLLAFNVVGLAFLAARGHIEHAREERPSWQAPVGQE